MWPGMRDSRTTRALGMSGGLGTADPSANPVPPGALLRESGPQEHLSPYPRDGTTLSKWECHEIVNKNPQSSADHWQVLSKYLLDK